MRIHHFTMPANNPLHVATVLAELLDARVMPLPYSRDSKGVSEAGSNGSSEGSKCP